ncbi:MAG: DUF3124 domain-containing protein [Magnetococcales bacterium]|nr:DUF3124 domain-containing protein [Magnetococcales bacterium]
MPVYSSVLHGNINATTGKPDEMLLSSMLSVRNTDLSRSMTITSVKYYDTRGMVLREYLPGPRVLAPMESVNFFVEYKEREGGSGANFVVTWQSSQLMNQPILETVNVYHWGTQGQAFISRGQVIHTHDD